MPFGKLNRDANPFGKTDLKPSESFSHSAGVHKTQVNSRDKKIYESISISKGALIEVVNKDDHEMRFTIDFDVDELLSANSTNSIRALKRLQAVLQHAGTAFVADTSINYALQSSAVFSCDVLLISFDLFDAVVEVLQDSKCLSPECQQLAVKLLNMIGDSSTFASTSLDLSQKAIAARHPQLLELLAAATLTIVDFRSESTLLRNALRSKEPSPPTREAIHRVHDLIVNGIELFDSEGDHFVRFSRAVEMLGCTSNALNSEHQERLAGLLPRFLSYVMENRCTAKMARLLLELLKKVSIEISSSVAILEDILMIACFHPDVEVQGWYLTHLTSNATEYCSYQYKNPEARTWWTQRCLPTWIDMVVRACPHVDFVCIALGHLLQQPILVDEEVPRMSLFTVAMVDSGAYAKLNFLAQSLPASEGARRRQLFQLCGVVKSNGGRGFTANANVEQLQFVTWSWKNHSGFNHPERMAVCAVFTAPLYKHPKNGDVGPLPSEIAHEICSYLPIRRCKIPTGLRSSGSTNGYARQLDKLNTTETNGRNSEGNSWWLSKR